MVAKSSTAPIGDYVSRGASYDDWLEVYNEIVNDRVNLTVRSCPNCSRVSLNLVYVVYGRNENRGGAALWCKNCLNGIYLGRVECVGGYLRVLSSISGQAQGGPIPDYTVVTP